jgi:hypothetical protein
MKSIYREGMIIRVAVFLLLLVSLVSLSFVTHAEGGCPPGYYPTTPPGQQGPQGCAPIPDESQAQGQSAGPRWVSRWGAIATDEPNGVLGAVTNMPSKRKAGNAALADCKTKGGSKCKLETSYSNGCAALVVGEKVYNVGSAATENEAIQSGMKICSAAGDGGCHVYYSACSPPEQIQ